MPTLRQPRCEIAVLAFGNGEWEDYPQQWLLLEALKAHSEGDQRILDELAILGSFPDSVKAMHDYSLLHRQSPELELYVFHTSREKLDIVERQWLGIRGLQ